MKKLYGYLLIFLILSSMNAQITFQIPPHGLNTHDYSLLKIQNKPSSYHWQPLAFLRLNIDLHHIFDVKNESITLSSTKHFYKHQKTILFFHELKKETIWQERGYLF